MPDAPINPAAPKARPLDYAPPVPLIDRVRRYLPTRDQFTGFLKNMVWVAPITLLIWVYAEREQSVVEGSIVASIDVKASDASRVVTLETLHRRSYQTRYHPAQRRPRYSAGDRRPRPVAGGTLMILLQVRCVYASS